MRKAYQICTAALASFVLVTSGCNIITGKDKSPFKPDTNSDSFSDYLAERVDPEIISYECKRESGYGITDYCFRIQSDHAEGVGDEAKKLYKATNELLAKGEYKDSKVCVAIVTEGPAAYATCYVIAFANYEDNRFDKTDDEIVSVTVGGINSACACYDKYYHYEINDLNYWEYYSDIEVRTSEFLEYTTMEISLDENVKSIKEYISDFDGYVEDQGMYVLRNGTGICNFQWDFKVNEDKITGSEFASASEMINALRMKINEYYAANPDDELLRNRVEFSFSGGYGHFDNFTFKKDGAPLLGSFSVICMQKTTIEELCRFEDVFEVDLYKRSVEEIRQVLDSVPGIKYVITHNDKTNDALAPDYSNVIFC